MNCFDTLIDKFDSATVNPINLKGNFITPQLPYRFKFVHPLKRTSTILKSMLYEKNYFVLQCIAAAIL